MSPCDPVTDFPDDEIAWLHENVWLGPAVAQARGVMEAIAEARADAVVGDTGLFGAMAAAEASGLPSAALHSTVYGDIRRLAPAEPAYRAAAREQMAAIDRAVQAELGVRELEALGQPAGV